MNLSEMFHSTVVTVEPTATVQTVTQKMKTENVGAVVVVEDGNIVGIVTDRDIALRLGLDESRWDAPIKDVMSTDVITIWDDQGVFNATQYLLGHRIRRLPIIDRTDRLVGIVTSDDLLVLLAREFSNLTKAIEPVLAMKSF